MLHFFLLLSLPFLAFCHETIAYLQWDNKTVATEEELALDPFLLFRTKIAGREKCYNIEDSFLALLDYNFGYENKHYREENSWETQIANSTHSFDYESPIFAISTNCETPEKIWWQISADPTFQEIASNLDQCEAFTEQITLDAMAETFLNPDQSYYFRAKTIVEGKAGPWSDPFPFFVDKPNQAQKIKFIKIEPKKYEISWEKDSSPTAEYLIFGSNSQDFIPSIYYDKQVLAISSEKEVEIAPSYNFIALTPSNKIEIDGSLAYYRVVVLDKQQLSVPSELIYIYDNDLHQMRDHLIACDDRIAKRVYYDSCSPYLALTENVLEYLSHPYISEETWQKVKPFLLPENHPVRHTLDKMFSKKRISQSLTSLNEAGFKTKGGPNNHSKTIFCQHKNIKGYVAKIIPDEFDADEVTRLLSRIYGAKTVQEIIDKYNYHKIIKVPQKWLYVLPPEPSPPSRLRRKNFILIAEDMNIYAREENYPLWKSFLMTDDLLLAIYTVITEGGFNDCVYAFNIPFSKDGRISFIDTEDHHKWPIPYHRLRKYLSIELAKFWDQLTQAK